MIRMLTVPCRALFLSGLILAGCASSAPRSTPDEPAREWAETPSALDEGKAGQDYRKIQNMYEKGEFKNALSALQRLEKNSSSGANSPQVQNLYGLIYLKLKDPGKAVERFKKALNLNPSASFKNYLAYNLATSYYEARNRKEAKTALSQIEPDQLVPETRIKFYYLNSLFLNSDKQFEQSAESLLVASKLFSQVSPAQLGTLPESFRKQLVATLKGIKPSSTFETLWSSNEASPFADEVLFALANRASSEMQNSKSERALRALVSDFPNSPHYTDAIEKLRLVQQTSSADGRSVGVLLPMTGRFSKFGSRNLEAISLAFRIFNTDQPDSQVTLHIEDCGEDPAQAVQALEKLYYEHNVVAIMGPLLGKGIEAITKRAQELGVPIISLSPKSGTQGDYVFQSTVTPRHQAYEIARFAIQKEGLKKFAILEPKDQFGEEYTQHFWKAVEELGGEVVGVETYPPNETDFRTQVDKLVGLYYRDARKRELDQLKALRDSLKITRKNFKTQKYFELPPIVDFDAVFIPDSAKVVAQVLPTFAYRDVDNVRYLGISTWNSPQLLERAKGYVDQSLFVDAFYSQSDSPEIRKFVEGFKKTFDDAPSALEAQTFDAASVLERALVLASAQSGGGSVSRSQLREQLMQVKDFAGVTGQISYENGEFIHRLKVLRVINGKIVEATEGHPLPPPTPKLIPSNTAATL